MRYRNRTSIVTLSVTASAASTGSSFKNWFAKLWKKSWKVICAASVVIGLITGVLGIYSYLSKQKSITVDLQDNAIVPHCLTITGTSSPGSGMVLIEAHHSSFGRYYFNRPLDQDGNRFLLTTNIGGDASSGQTYVMEFFYVRKDLADFVMGIGGTGPDGVDGQGFGPSLPPGAESIVKRTVHRGEQGDTKRC